MKTPKEKALELYLKYHNLFINGNSIIAKQCAIIAVDESLNAIEGMVDIETGYSADEYYLEVKQEIEKL